MSGRSPPLYCTLTLIAMQGHQTNIVSHIQRIGFQPEKTTSHGGQSRSWSAEKGKEDKRKSLAVPPPTPLHHPHYSFGENNKNRATHLQALRRSRSVSRQHKDSFDSSTMSSMGVATQNLHASVRDEKFPSLVASLISWRV